MLKLDLKREPYWLDLPAGVRINVRPLSTAVMSAAQASVIKQISSIRQERKSLANVDADVSDVPDVEDEQTRIGLSEALLIKSLARAAIMAWEGVLLPEGNEIAPVNNSNVNELMDIWFIAQEFWKQYTNSLSLLEIEGNASGLAANGISAAGQNIVKDATKKISHAAEEKKIN